MTEYPWDAPATIVLPQNSGLQSSIPQEAVPLARAIKIVMEHLPLLDRVDAQIVFPGGKLDGMQIALLYESPLFPLDRKTGKYPAEGEAERNRGCG